ncbi:RNA methyltransferase [Streptococcus sp. 121]|uniref:TrmH family RNA methyltransferase n=1 Tax=Streptococcus sp. 121 TaxID=2797637 RepID=UPI0018F0FAFA|nr:RNA methyltransferase [Streptococcus sp. 121]MBJ6746310.1 RNA methyltransferase [Streptococcus sp. 121]
MTIITSKTNPLIKKIKKLQKKKYRKDSYLIEGWHLFEEAYQAGVEFGTIFILEEEKERLPKGLAYQLVSTSILAELADSKTPQGIVAEVKREILERPDLSQGKWLYLEEVQDPGNVGTMIRTADAAGFTGVLVSPGTADIYSPKTLRSMQGSHWHLPIYEYSLDELTKVSHAPLLVTSLKDRSQSYLDLAPMEQLILLMGNEGQGASGLAHSLADQTVHIPMSGQAESLNVAIAAGILLFHLKNS